jgi:hypothetical protein
MFRESAVRRSRVYYIWGGILRSFTRVAAATSAVFLAALVVTGAGLATRGSDFVTCNDGSSYAITVTQQPSDNSVGWGVGTFSGGDHLIPTSFSGTFYDDTIGATLDSFTQAKGKGNGQHNQTQLTCSTPAETGTVADFLGGEALPPEWADLGVQLTDQVTASFTVTGVHQE